MRNKTQKIATTIIATAMILSSIGICSVAAASRTYSGITAEYSIVPWSSKLTVTGGTQVKHALLSERNNYFKGKYDHYTTKNCTSPYISYNLFVGQSVLCVGVGNNFNNNFLFKYN